MKEKIKELLKEVVENILSVDELRDKYYPKKDKRLVYNTINRYRKKGFIERINNRYFFTPEGKKILRGVSQIVTEELPQIEIHDLQYTWKILDYGITTKHKWIDFIENFLIRNDLISNKSLKDNVIETRLFYSRVRITSKNICILPKKLTFASVEKVVTEGENETTEIAKKIEAFLGIKLESRYTTKVFVSRRHIAHVEHPLALLCKKHHYKIEVYDDETGERLYHTDVSDGVWHLESDNIKRSPELMEKTEDLLLDLSKGYSVKDNFKDIRKAEKESKELKPFILSLSDNQKEISKVLKNLYKDTGSMITGMRPILTQITNLNKGFTDLNIKVSQLYHPPHPPRVHISEELLKLMNIIRKPKDLFKYKQIIILLSKEEKRILENYIWSLKS